MSEVVISEERCFKKVAPDGPSLFQNGNLVFQAHHVGWIVASFFTVVAIITSFWLVNKHLKWYTDKHEQRYIVRILFMVPIYAVISLASFFFWNHSTPLLLLRDGYESTVLTSFFYLLLNYLSHDPDEQRKILLKAGLSREADAIALRNGEQPKRWMFPLGFIKWKPSDGLFFLQLMKWGVLQYCVVRPTTTLIAVILDYVGLYCEDSWGFGWGHVYITVIVSTSVTVAMYCLLQLYFPVAKYLAPRKPILKLFAIKAIVFLTFWQATALSVLSMFGVVKDTNYMTADDINIGFGALLETFEMMLFGFLHLKAFTYKVYRHPRTHNSKEPPPIRMPRLRALGHAMDFRETFRELWVGVIYLRDKMLRREPTSDIAARRSAYYEHAFGRSRLTRMDGPNTHDRCPSEKSEENVTFPTVQVEVVELVEENITRQWLGHGIYREKSDSLEAQIESELERRGYGYHVPGRGRDKSVVNVDEGYGHTHGPQRSWWRSIYDRISQSGPEAEEDEERPPGFFSRVSRQKSGRPSKSHSRDASRDIGTDLRVFSDYYYELDELPPPSLIRTYRTTQKHQQAVYSPVASEDDMLSPLSVFSERQNAYSPRHQRQSRRSRRKPDSESPSRDARAPAPLSASPPPQSLLPPIHFSSSRSDDSLFGRVFPSKSSDAHLSAHGTDNTHISSLPLHQRSTPQSVANGYQIGMAGERSALYSQALVTAEPEEPIYSEASSSADPIKMNLSDTHEHRTSPAPRSSGSPHRVASPTSVHSESTRFRPSPHLAENHAPTPSRLRRSSALIHSSRNRPSRQRRQSEPLAQIPQHEHKLQHANRRVSTPEGTRGYQVIVTPPDNVYQSNRTSRPISSALYSRQTMNGNIAQPSYSGSAAATRYADTDPRNSEYFAHTPIEDTLPSPRMLTAETAYRISDNRSRNTRHTDRIRDNTHNKVHPDQGPWS